jgi:O-antigen ligase/tetratricopeptide (TPR) repeat protein
VVEILFGLWLILSLYNKRFRPKKSWILFFLAAFVFFSIISTIFGASPYRSFWSNYERMEGLITYLHLLTYFLVLGSALNSEKLWKGFFHTSIGVSFLVALYGLLQLTGEIHIYQSDVRLDSTLGNASYLAIYMAFNIFLAFWYFVKEKEWYRWFYIPLIVLELIVLYYTATRGTILGFVGGILSIIFLVAIFSRQKKIKMAFTGFFAVVIILLAGFWIIRDSSFIKQNQVLSRFANISLKETTTQSRFIIWGMSWEGFKERPLFGWGPENYNLIFNKFYKPILWNQEPWFDRAHNVFFDRLTMGGIFGLFFYLGLFISAFYYLLAKRKETGFSITDSIVLTSLLIAYFFHNLFVFDNIVSYLMFFGILSYIHFRKTCASAVELAAKEQISFDAGDTGKSFYSAVIVVVTVFSVYFINVPAILASRSLLNALAAAGSGDLQESMRNFEKSLSYNSFGSTETREHLTGLAMKVASAQNVDPLQKNKIFETASAEMEKQVRKSPEDIRYLVFLGALYSKEQKYDKAVEILEKAITLSPKKQQLYFELGSAYLNKKEYDKAAEILKTAFELDPSFDEARNIYAASLIFGGKIDLAENILREKYGTATIADDRIFRAYASLKDVAKAVGILEKIVEQNPDDAQYRVSLASNYLLMGERQKAIEQLQKAIEIEPRFKQQGEYYISEITAGRNP